MCWPGAAGSARNADSWTEWLSARSGGQKKAPASLGNRQYPPLGPAPGTYVFE